MTMIVMMMRLSNGTMGINNVRTKNKEELLPVAWHPNRVMDWCVPEDEKKETKKLLLTV